MYTPSVSTLTNLASSLCNKAINKAKSQSAKAATRRQEILKKLSAVDSEISGYEKDYVNAVRLKEKLEDFLTDDALTK